MSTGVGSGCGQPGAQKAWPGEPPGTGPAALTRVQRERCLAVIGECRGYDVESLV